MAGSQMTTGSAPATGGRLGGRDLINIGIYAALYCVAMTVVGIFGYIPIVMFLLSVLCPLICGIPFMMFMTRVKKPGMILIFNVLAGLFMWLTGMGFYTPLVSVATGIAAELVWRAGGYRSSVAAVLAYAVLSVFIVGNYLPFFLDPSYLSSTGQKIGQGYVEAIRPFLQGWLIPAEAVACFVSGLVGGLIGRSVLRRHFQKAGIL